MATDGQGPIEHDLVESAMLASITVTGVEVTPTSTGDRHVRIVGRLGDDDEPDAEWAALGFIYAVGLLSFHDARPRGVSGIEFQEHDDWTAADMLRCLRYERGRLVFGSDYVRERMMKTDVTVRPDGSFTLDTTNSGEAATRWVTRLQGKKVLGPVPGSGRTDGSDDTEPGEGGATDET
jgi:hypothetical protein